MTYNVKKLSECDPTLCNKLRKHCYSLNGICQDVHKEMGPYLNEYMYQDALEILLKDNNISHTREYYFSVEFRGRRINHKHYIDFLIYDKIILECKAIERIGPEQRQQLWNYMRLTKKPVGILYNFAPVYDQCERYYLNTETNEMFMF